MGAVELSIDKIGRDTAPHFLCVHDSNSSQAQRTDGTAHGFDSIGDDTHFASSDFSSE
jgi:hypothetical protein